MFVATGLLFSPWLLSGCVPSLPPASQSDSANVDTDADTDADSDADTDYVSMNGSGMVALQPGTFTMGGGAGDPDFEYTDHEVTLTHAFWIGRTEITRAEWEADPADSVWTYYSTGCTASDCPADILSWYDAVKYANWLSDGEGLADCYTVDGFDVAEAYLADPYSCPGYRLPTEAEWEYAARAGEDTTYSGGNTAADVAWTSENSDSRSHSVCTTPVAENAFGLCDMSGNAWEWVNDWSSDSYGGYGDGSPGVDPAGPEAGDKRGLRGGYWYNVASHARVDTRYQEVPSVAYDEFGFRLARSVP